MISRQFLLAGNATFTVSNPEGKHYTFRVRAGKKNIGKPKPYFISLLTGPDNSNSYTYMGMVREEGVFLTRASKYTKDTLPYKVANWAVEIILQEKKLPEGYRIDHAGKCGKCGRKLTTPESIEMGLGPVCASRL